MQLRNSNQMLRRGVLLQQTQKKKPNRKSRKNVAKEKGRSNCDVSNVVTKTTFEKSLNLWKLHCKGAKIQISKGLFKQINKGLI